MRRLFVLFITSVLTMLNFYAEEKQKEALFNSFLI